MFRTARIIFAVVMLTGITLSAVADRGMGKKNKLKILTANFNNTVSLRSAISFNLRSGFTYKNSQLSRTTFNNKVFSSNANITYQKGNNVFVVPSKQHIAAMPDMRQGYTGFKIVIRH